MLVVWGFLIGVGVLFGLCVFYVAVKVAVMAIYMGRERARERIRRERMTKRRKESTNVFVI